jgi:hypothetical protein
LGRVLGKIDARFWDKAKLRHTTVLFFLLPLRLLREPTMASLLSSVLAPYASNRNTGNVYEIATALTLLRAMGVSDAEFSAAHDLLESIVTHNASRATALRTVYATVAAQPVGSGLLFDGHRVVDIKNATQDDALGRTGDLILVTDTGAMLSVSVCEGKVKKGGVIEKCLTNPSARRFGCTPEDLESFKTIQAGAVVAFKAEMTAKYGAEESAWPSRVRTTVAADACSAVAAATAARFATLSDDAKAAVFTDLLRIENGLKPADYLALVDGKTLTVKFFRFDSAAVVGWTPRVVAEGIWLRLYNGDVLLGSTQVKFNNGIYHKGKTSSLLSSWNSTFNLTDMFRMKAI